MIAVSKCLVGINCKYSGGNNYSDKLMEYLKDKDFLAICPEVTGGLKTPRVPCEISGERIISQDGQDCTKEYYFGAQEALKVCKACQVTEAILQTRSPSCGCGIIYDGTFTGNKIVGDGITAKLLKENGIKVINIEEL